MAPAVEEQVKKELKVVPSTGDKEQLMKVDDLPVLSSDDKEIAKENVKPSKTKSEEVTRDAKVESSEEPAQENGNEDVEEDKYSESAKYESGSEEESAKTRSESSERVVPPPVKEPLGKRRRSSSHEKSKSKSKSKSESESGSYESERKHPARKLPLPEISAKPSNLHKAHKKLADVKRPNIAFLRTTTLNFIEELMKVLPSEAAGATPRKSGGHHERDQKKSHGSPSHSSPRKRNKGLSMKRIINELKTRTNVSGMRSSLLTLFQFVCSELEKANIIAPEPESLSYSSESEYEKVSKSSTSEESSYSQDDRRRSRNKKKRMSARFTSPRRSTPKKKRKH